MSSLIANSLYPKSSHFTLQYDPDVTKKGLRYVFSPEDLQSKLLNSQDLENEAIEEVTIYKFDLDQAASSNLSSLGRVLFGPLNVYRFHAFVVIKTPKWYYSVDKYCTHVGIQRSQSLTDVRDFERGVARVLRDPSRIVQLMSAHGRGTIKDLVNVIADEGIVSKEYNSWTENCKHTSACIYNRLSKGHCSIGWFNADLLHPFNCYNV